MSDNQECRILKPTCSGCGEPAASFELIAVTEDKAVHLQWECSCGDKRYVQIPLSQLEQWAPPSKKAITPSVFQPEDLKFLKALHIADEEAA